MKMAVFRNVRFSPDNGRITVIFAILHQGTPVTIGLPVNYASLAALPDFQQAGRPRLLEAQDRCSRGYYRQTAVDPVVLVAIACAHGRHAFARGIPETSLRLHAGVRQRHDHVLRRDRVFRPGRSDSIQCRNGARLSRRRRIRYGGGQFVRIDDGNAFRLGEGYPAGRRFAPSHPLYSFDDLVLLEASQTLQASARFLRLIIQTTCTNRLLDAVMLRQIFRGGMHQYPPVLSAPVRACRAQPTNPMRAPSDRPSQAGGVGAALMMAVKSSILANATARPQVRPPFTRLIVGRGTPCHDLAAMRRETLQHLFQVQQLWLAIDQRHHVHARHLAACVCLATSVERLAGTSPRLSSMTTHMPDLSIRADIRKCHPVLSRTSQQCVRQGLLLTWRVAARRR
jgi:hypothetical protein